MLELLTATQLSAPELAAVQALCLALGSLMLATAEP